MLEGRRSDGFSLKRYLQLPSSFYAIEPIFARFIERSIVGNEPHRFFPPFRLDAPNAQLWRGDQVISLRRKTFDVLLYLVDHRGQLVTKAALLAAVWAGAMVSDSMPTTCVAVLR